MYIPTCVIRSLVVSVAALPQNRRSPGSRPLQSTSPLSLNIPKSSPILACWEALRGRSTPLAKYTLRVNPLQSTFLMDVPPHMYGTPRNL